MATEHAAMAHRPSITGTEKLNEVIRLIDLLERDLKEKIMLPPQRNATLDELKIHTRSACDADPLFTSQGILILCRHSFDGNSPTTARAALKCLANVMLLEASTRQIFVDLGYAPMAAEKLRNDNREDEFLASRLLFLSTYETNLDFETLFTNDQLAESINTNLSRHAKHFSKSKGPLPPADIIALSETLKLLFNLTQFYPEQAQTFAKSSLSIFKIFAQVKIPTPPLEPPVTYLINSLLNLDLEDKKARYFAQNPVFPGFDRKFNLERLIKILDSAVREYNEEQLEQLAPPLVSLIRKIYEFSPDQVKFCAQKMLLPSDEERVQPLGKSESLSARLLRLSSSAVAPNLRETLSNLMFELSDKNATNFVKNVGYGFAAGFLMSHDMPIPENAMEAWSTGESGDGVEINPITGQRRDREPVDSGTEMTDDEKEREAERLFVLFERLKSTGVIDVQNPITQAKHEGRFEEVED